MIATQSAAHYRDIAVATDVLSAEGPALTAILYEELLDALHRAKRPIALRSLVLRAMTILREIDAGVAEDGSRFAQQMKQIHARCMVSLEKGRQENDPKWIQRAIETITPIAEAWSVVRARS